MKPQIKRMLILFGIIFAFISVLQIFLYNNFQNSENAQIEGEFFLIENSSPINWYKIKR